MEKAKSLAPPTGVVTNLDSDESGRSICKKTYEGMINSWLNITTSQLDVL